MEGERKEIKGVRENTEKRRRVKREEKKIIDKSFYY